MTKSCRSCVHWKDVVVEYERDARGLRNVRIICPHISDEVRRPEMYWCRNYVPTQRTLETL